MPTRTPDPFTDIDGGNTRPDDDRGVWEYWGGSFKEAFSDSRDSNVQNPPFKASEGPDGLKDWQASDNRLKLIDSDWSAESGQVSFTLNDGWQMLVYMKTENDDYFEDNSTDRIRSNWRNKEYHALELAEERWPAVWVQDDAEFSDSRTMFVLNGDDDDYVSVDIDAEDATIGQMRVRLDGEQYFSNTAVDDEVWITMVWLRYWDPTFEWEEDEDPTTLPIVCQTGFVWDPETNACVRAEEEEEEDKDDDKDDDGSDTLDDVNIILIGVAIVLVLYGSFVVARRGA